MRFHRTTTAAVLVTAWAGLPVIAQLPALPDVNPVAAPTVPVIPATPVAQTGSVGPSVVSGLEVFPNQPPPPAGIRPAIGTAFAG